jgi:hypothetical protein
MGAFLRLGQSGAAHVGGLSSRPFYRAAPTAAQRPWPAGGVSGAGAGAGRAAEKGHSLERLPVKAPAPPIHADPALEGEASPLGEKPARSAPARVLAAGGGPLGAAVGGGPGAPVQCVKNKGAKESGSDNLLSRLLGYAGVIGNAGLAGHFVRRTWGRHFGGFPTNSPSLLKNFFKFARKPSPIGAGGIVLGGASILTARATGAKEALKQRGREEWERRWAQRVTK